MLTEGIYFFAFGGRREADFTVAKSAYPTESYDSIPTFRGSENLKINLRLRFLSVAFASLTIWLDQETASLGDLDGDTEW